MTDFDVDHARQLANEVHMEKSEWILAARRTIKVARSPMLTEMLEHPLDVMVYLNEAVAALNKAHAVAGVTEGDRTDLVGNVRDLIFGLNSAVDALATWIEASIQAGGRE